MIYQRITVQSHNRIQNLLSYFTFFLLSAFSLLTADFFDPLTLSIKNEPNFSRILSEINNLPDSNYNQAVKEFILARQKVDTEKIVQKFQELISRHPDSFLANLANYELAKIFLLNRKYDKSLSNLLLIRDYRIEEADRFLKQVFVDPLTYNDYWLAYVYLRSNQPLQSIRKAQQFIKSSHNKVFKVSAYIIISESYILESKYLNAKNTLIQAKNYNTDRKFDAFISYRKGYCLEKMEDYSSAIEQYKGVIRNYPYTQYSYSAETRLYEISFKSGNGINYSELANPLSEIEMQNNHYITECQLSPGYYIQINAFSSEKNAVKQKDSLLNNNYPGLIFQRTVSGRTLFIVTTGPYSSSQKARNEQVKINSFLNSTTFIFNK